MRSDCTATRGDVAQLGEHRVCNARVVGSSPIVSTRKQGIGGFKRGLSLLLSPLSGNDKPATSPLRSGKLRKISATLCHQKGACWSGPNFSLSKRLGPLTGVAPRLYSVSSTWRTCGFRGARLVACFPQISGRYVTALDGRCRPGS